MLSSLSVMYSPTELQMTWVSEFTKDLIINGQNSL